MENEPIKSVEELPGPQGVYYDPKSGERIDFGYTLEGRVVKIGRETQQRIPEHIQGIKKFLEAQNFSVLLENN